MYSPAHYRAIDQDLLKEILISYPFASMISVDQGVPVISHLPFIFEENTFLAHMARANSHWKLAQLDSNVTLIFNGPQGYVSPEWYSPDPENVPTWNYITVHVKGEMVVETDQAKVAQKLKLMSDHFEKQNGTTWELPVSGLENLTKQIVVFNVVNLSFEGKLKLSQNQTLASRSRVISELETKNPALAQWMKATGSR